MLAMTVGADRRILDTVGRRLTVNTRGEDFGDLPVARRASLNDVAAMNRGAGISRRKDLVSAVAIAADRPIGSLRERSSVHTRGVGGQRLHEPDAGRPPELGIAVAASAGLGDAGGVNR